MPNRAKDILILLLTCLTLGTCSISGYAQSGGDKRIALVMGNSKYPDAPLRNPANDARAMADVLTDLGFEVKLLLDQRRVETLREVRAFSDRLKGDGVVGLFYFAGHGMQAKGKNFVIPVDVDIRSEDEIDEQGVDVQFVVDKMSAAGNSSLILILDACRNNPFVAKGVRGASGLAAIDGPAGTLVAFSAAPGKVAFDGEGANSPYTKRIVETLSIPGIPIEDVFKRVRIGVLQDTGARQTPWENTALTRDFYFKPVRAGEKRTDSVLAPLYEDRHWAEVKESRSIYEFVAFYKKFPGTQRVGLVVDGINRILKLVELAPIRREELSIFASKEADAGFDSRLLNKYSSEYYGLAAPKGYLVSEVYKGSVAAKAGLLPGDIVLKVNGLDYPHVTTPIQFVELNSKLRAGEYIVAVVWRDRKEITLSGVLDRQPLESMVRNTAGTLISEKKFERAVELLTPLTRQGDSKAKALLGMLYQRGLGVSADKALSAKFMSEAAEDGNKSAAFFLGLGYFLGTAGVEQSDSKAFRWAKVAADAGLQEGMGMLAVMYFLGRGTHKDPVKAHQLAIVAANLGNTDGMMVLGWMYEQGALVGKDLAMAKEWYQKAAILNSPTAKQALQRLEGR